MKSWTIVLLGVVLDHSEELERGSLVEPLEYMASFTTTVQADTFEEALDTAVDALHEKHEGHVHRIAATAFQGPHTDSWRLLT